MTINASKLGRSFDSNLIASFDGTVSYLSKSAKDLFEKLAITGLHSLGAIFKQVVDEDGRELKEADLPHHQIISGKEKKAQKLIGFSCTGKEIQWFNVQAEARYSKLGLPPSLTLYFIKDENYRLPVANFPGITQADFLEYIDEGYILVDQEWCVQYFNRKASEFAFSVLKTYFKSGVCILDYTPPELHNDLLERLKAALKGETIHSQRKIKLDDQTIYYDLSYMPYFTNGKATGVIIRMKDVTQHALLKKELDESNERFLAAAVASYDLIWERDFEEDKYHFPSGHSKIFGYDVSEVDRVEIFLNKVIHPDDRVMLVEFLKTCYEKKTQEINYPLLRYVTKDGETRYVKARSFINYNRAGKPKKSIGFLHDITDSYVAEKELRTSNERYELATKASLDVIFELDFKTDLFTFSEAFSRLFGYNHLEKWSRERFFTEVIHHDDRMKVRQFSQSCFDQQRVMFQYIPHRYWKINGDISYVQVHAYVTYDADGQTQKMVGIVRDITEQHLLTLYLQKAIERYDLVAKATSDILWEWELENDKIKFWNEELGKRFGYSDYSEVSPDWYFEKVHPDDIDRLRKSIDRSLYNMLESHTCQYRLRDASGRYREVLDRSYVVYNENGEPARIAGAIQDISEIKLLEQRIIEETLTYQKKLNEIAIYTQEKERETFGKELHDNINQLLAISLLYLSMGKSDEGQRLEMIDKTTETIKNVIQEIRNLSKRMISPVLDVGLEEALQSLCTDTSTLTRIPVRFSKDHFEYKGLPADMQLMLYRVLQEQINNIIKHAHASEVNVKLGVANNTLHLSIHDNGRGFNIDNKSKGVGMRNMKSRVEAYQGCFEVKSSVGKGTEVVIKIPV